ncbi:hypothetical protein [Crateriforma conspicua]|nr:hypothetical protein [Crateriforma conspicua]
MASTELISWLVDTTRRNRGPAWRLEIAREIVSGSALVHRLEDVVIPEVVGCLQGYDCDGHGSGKRRLDMPKLQAIHQNDFLRWSIEARLLSRQTAIEISAKTDVPADRIRDYHDVYFDVSALIDAPRWVVTHVIDGGSGNAPPQQKALYRYSYFGGRHVCEHWFRYWGLLQAPTDLSTDEGRAVEQLRMLILCEALDGESETKWCQTLMQFGDIGYKDGGHVDTVTELLTQHVHRHLVSLAEGPVPTVAKNMEQVSGNWHRSRASFARTA